MNNTEFHHFTDALWLDIEKRLEHRDGEADVDCDVNDGILTLQFENGSKIIINRQEALRQVWMATKHGGYHFDQKDGEWICDRGGERFWDLLERAVSQQAGEEARFR